MTCASRLVLAAACLVATLAACADPGAPLAAPQEVLLVVNSTEGSLSIVPVETPTAAVKVPLGGIAPTPVGVSARNEFALVPLGLDNAVAVVNLRSAAVVLTIPLPANSGATGSAFVDDSIGYVANPNLNTVTRVNYLTGDTASVAVGVYPQGMVYTRGKLFVLNGNLVNFVIQGPSWVTVIDPVTKAKATGGPDSIPLPGPGNAGFADVGSDGRLYIINTGGYGPGDLGRLSIVDPVQRTEVGNFGGFGQAPGPLASDAGDRLFISSYAEGLMEFNLTTSQVIRGAGNGVPIVSNASVVVDSKGRIYALETGKCAGGDAGKAHVLRSDLTESGTITLGECPVGALVTSIPPAP